MTPPNHIKGNINHLKAHHNDCLGDLFVLVQQKFYCQILR